MPPNLNHARVLDFCGGKLVSLWDDQSQVPLKLQELNLQRCYKLQRVPDSICRLRGLQKLDFSECLFLKTLSEEFCYLESLEVLSLNGCLNLECLPSGFGRMRRLQKLDFSHCFFLKTLSEEFCNLESLEVLSLNGCLNLECLPSRFGDMRSLRDVSLRECKKLKALPESFGFLPQIEYLDMKHCKNVKIEEGSFGSISTLREVTLVDCPKLETFPTRLTCQRSLKKLGVATVDRDRVRTAGFGHNEILIDIPENIGDLSQVELGILTRIPQSIGKLSHLARLDLWNLANMRVIPDSIGNLSRLSRLGLKNCPRLQELPTSIGNLSCLSQLSLWNCRRLQELPTSIGNLSCLSTLELSDCPRLQGLPTSIGNLSDLSKLDLTSCSDLQNITGLSSLRNLSTLKLNDCHKLTESATLDLLQQCKHLKNLDLLLTDNFLTEENCVLLENLISPSLEFTFTASAIPYPTAWLDSYHFQMMSKRDTDTMPSVLGSRGLKCSLPAATKKKCAAIIICFVSVLQLKIDELNDNQLSAPPLAQFSCSISLPAIRRFSCSKLGDTIHLKMLSARQFSIHQSGEKSYVHVSMGKLSSSVKGYFKCGWFKIIEKGEEKLIQQIRSDFFRELRLQRPLAVARASAPSLLDLRNVHALDLASCTIRRTLYLYKTPIQEEKMELVLRKKQLFWRDDKELEHLDLSIMNTRSITELFLTLKSMVNIWKSLYLLEVWRRTKMNCRNIKIIL
eukprot:Gb_09105 [translate_table: standard]